MEKVYMDPMTGKIDSYDGWFYTLADGTRKNAVENGEVFEVTKVNGNWVSVEFLESLQ